MYHPSFLISYVLCVAREVRKRRVGRNEDGVAEEG